MFNLHYIIQFCATCCSGLIFLSAVSKKYLCILVYHVLLKTWFTKLFLVKKNLNSTFCLET